MSRKNKATKTDLRIKVIDAFKDVMIAYLDAAAANPIMATSAGMLPFVLMHPIVPGPAMLGVAAVGAVAGMRSIPNVAINIPGFSIGVSAVEAKWPAQINIIRPQKSMMTADKEEELKTLFKAIGLKQISKLP